MKLRNLLFSFLLLCCGFGGVAMAHHSLDDPYKRVGSIGECEDLCEEYAIYKTDRALEEWRSCCTHDNSRGMDYDATGHALNNYDFHGCGGYKFNDIKTAMPNVADCYTVHKFCPQPPPKFCTFNKCGMEWMDCCKNHPDRAPCDDYSKEEIDEASANNGYAGEKYLPPVCEGEEPTPPPAEEPEEEDGSAPPSSSSSSSESSAQSSTSSSSSSSASTTGGNSNGAACGTLPDVSDVQECCKNNPSDAACGASGSSSSSSSSSSKPSSSSSSSSVSSSSSSSSSISGGSSSSGVAPFQCGDWPTFAEAQNCCSKIKQDYPNENVAAYGCPLKCDKYTGSDQSDCCAKNPTDPTCKGTSSAGIDCSPYIDPTDLATCCAKQGAYNCGNSSSSSSSSSSTSSSSNDGSSSSSSSSSPSGGNGNTSGGTIKCGVLGLFTGCPAGGVLSTGGTPKEVAALLDAYANLINAFNGSDGGKVIMAEVAKKLASLPASALIAQTQAMQQSTGKQLSALQTLGAADKQTVIAVIDDAMKNSPKATGAVRSVIEKMRAAYANTNDPAKQRALLAHINNALKLEKELPKATAAAVLTPFRDVKTGKILLSPEEMAKAIKELYEVNQP